MARRGIIKSILSVSGIVALAKILGFVKQTLTANAFGATIQTDMISLSQGLVQDLDYLIVQALITAFVPVYLHVRAEDPKIVNNFVSNTIFLFSLLTFVISLLICILSGPIASILAPSYTEILNKELSNYIRIVCPVLVPIVLIAIISALLKANEIFIPGELVHVNQSVIYIVLILLIGKSFGPNTIVVALYAYALFDLVYIFICGRKKLGGHVSKPFQDENVRELIMMMGPLIVGYAMLFVNQQIDKIIVSGLDEGTVTAMSYAAVLSTFITSFVASICNVLFTYVTKEITEGNNAEAATLISNSVIQISTLMIPVSVIAVVNSADIVTIVFGHGRFDTSAITNCSFALAGYSVMFVPFVFRELFSRFQYGYGNSKQPMVNSIISIICNIILSIVLSRPLGVLGVTLASSISVIICAVLNMRTSYKENHYIRFRYLFKHTPAWAIEFVICILVSMAGRRYLADQSALLRFFIILTISFLLHFVVSYPVTKPLLNRVRHKKSI